MVFWDGDLTGALQVLESRFAPSRLQHLSLHEIQTMPFWCRLTQVDLKYWLLNEDDDDDDGDDGDDSYPVAYRDEQQ